MALLQFKALWRAWDFRDLTSGDTSSYFHSARLWADGLQVNFPWSPAYTAFYGSFLWVTSDPYLATTAHRVAIALLAGAGVLFVLRKVLPPHVALISAVWWALLPIVFNTLYEVHLFALLPILLYWALIVSGDSPALRGTALAVLAAASILVRNELGLATLIAAVVLAMLERARWREGAFTKTQMARAYGLPLAAAALLCAVAYSRSIVRYPEMSGVLRGKHTLNMCQVFAFGYQQRHPEWQKSPWTGCESLSQETFGVPQPTFVEMLRNNPGATFSHLGWNLGLIPAGLEVLLFDATASKVNPDYAPVTVSPIPRYLGFLALAGVAAALFLERRRSREPQPEEPSMRARLLLAALPVIVVSVPVALTQRPRPSYFFHVGVISIALICWAFDRLSRRLGISLRVARATVLVGAATIAIGMTPYYQRHVSGRPLRDKAERLARFAPALNRVQGDIVLGEWAWECSSYAGLHRDATAGTQLHDPLSNSIWNAWDVGKPFGDFLSERRIDAFYLDGFVLSRFRGFEQARRFLDNPGSYGFRVLAFEDLGKESWMLLVRERAAP